VRPEGCLTPAWPASHIVVIGGAVMLLNQIGEKFAAAGNTRAAEQCFDKAREAHQGAQTIREAAKQTDELSADDLLAHGSIEPGRAAGG